MALGWRVSHAVCPALFGSCICEIRGLAVMTSVLAPPLPPSQIQRGLGLFAVPARLLLWLEEQTRPAGRGRRGPGKHGGCTQSASFLFTSPCQSPVLGNRWVHCAQNPRAWSNLWIQASPTSVPPPVCFPDAAWARPPS